MDIIEAVPPNPLNILTQIYISIVKDKNLVIGYGIIAKDGKSNFQIELWDLVDKLLVFRHSSVLSFRTLEFISKEHIADAIVMVENEIMAYTKECDSTMQFLNADELKNQ